MTEHIVRISQRGQITIPKELRDRFGIHPGVEVEVVPTEDGLLIRQRTNNADPADSLSRILPEGPDADEVKRVLDERIAQGMHPVDAIVGILGTGGNTDEYMAEIRGR